MIYTHQRKAIEYITAKLMEDAEVLGLLVSGSIAHGFNTEKSDVDINIVISDGLHGEKEASSSLTYWESADSFYPGGYFDGKYVTLGYLESVAERGNEPSRFALHDSIIAFDKTGQLRGLLSRIGRYPSERSDCSRIRLLSQLQGWKWYCGEALDKEERYLLDVSVLKLILFGGRLLLLDNKAFFPYHKWFMRVLEEIPDKPEGLTQSVRRLLDCKSKENIDDFYNLIMNHKNWSGGSEYSWTSHFVKDIELNWTTGFEYIENI